MKFKIGDMVSPNTSSSDCWSPGVAHCIGVIEEITPNQLQDVLVKWVISEKGKVPNAGERFWYSNVSLKLAWNGVERMIQCLE